MPSLIIVESPAKAKTISKIVGSNYIVKASVGHITSLSDTKIGADSNKLEIAGVDIPNHFLPIYTIDPDKKDVVKELQKLAKESPEILFATDSDREGEAISWHLAQTLKIKDLSKIKRLEFHEITIKAIQEAIAHPRTLNLNLVEAQKARQVLDRLVGFKLSPVLWQVMSNYKLSAGRVQSPALALICQREEEIEAFVTQEYWEIEGLLNKKEKDEVVQNWIFESEIGEIVASKNVNLTLKENFKQIEDPLLLKFTKSKGEKLPKEIKNIEVCSDLTSTILKDNIFEVVSAEIKTEKSSPRPPFTTSTLQQAASSVLGYNPKLTMQLAQKLYEGLEIDKVPTALITYMRTDSVNLSQESIQAARKLIGKNYPQYLPAEPRYYKGKTRNAQEAHEAIRPIDPLLAPYNLEGKIEPKLLKLYELIWKQTVASQMTDEIRERQVFELENSHKDQFTGSVAWTVQAGFKALTGEKISSKTETGLELNQTVYLGGVYYTQHFTKPPSRYSQASLVKKLEELGIGRPSTFASIISTLQDREYVEARSSIGTNQMIPTSLGRKIYELLKENFTQVTSSILTATMEEDLDRISRGEEQYETMLDNFWWKFKQQVEEKSKEIALDRDKYKTSATSELCPVCQSTMTLKIGRFGEYFQCQTNSEHQFQKNYKEHEIALKEAREKYATQAEGKKCQECGKDLIVRVSKSSLNPYIACQEYKVGNKHTVLPINFGPCPKCLEEGRNGKNQGVLVNKKGFRGKSFVGCSLDKTICGYIVGQSAESSSAKVKAVKAKTPASKKSTAKVKKSS